MTSNAINSLDERHSLPRFARRRRWPKLLLGGWIVVNIAGLVIVLYLKHEEATAKAALAEELELVKASGQPARLIDLKPAAVDPEQDATPLLLATFGKLRDSDIEFEHDLYFKRWLGLPPNQPDVTQTELPLLPDPLLMSPLKGGAARAAREAQLQPPIDERAFADAIESNQDALHLLRQAIELPHCRLPCDYDRRDAMAAAIEGMSEIGSLSRLLSAEVILALGDGDSHRAAEAIDNLFALSELLRDEPGFSMQLLRTGVGERALAALSYLISLGELDDKDFNKLDERMKHMHETYRIAPGLIGDRARIVSHYEWCIEEGTVPDVELNRSLTADRTILRQQLAKYLAMVRRFLPHVDAMDRDSDDDLAKIRDEFDKRVEEEENEDGMSSLMCGFYSVAHFRARTFRQALVHARLAMRVDWFWDRHGRFPDSLHEVLDERFPELPLCTYSGEPSIYKKFSNSFVLYDSGFLGDNNLTRDMVEWNTFFQVVYPLAPAKSLD